MIVHRIPSDFRMLVERLDRWLARYRKHNRTGKLHNIIYHRPRQVAYWIE
jgi:hypothetical protein